MEMTLLLVEDEVAMLETMKLYLEGEGFRVFAVTNGQDALECARREQPSLVVLDWMLPGKSGIEVCKELRQSSACGIIMVTAKSEETDKIIGLELGADDYITKPFSLRELTSRIRSVLRRTAPIQVEAPPLQRGDLLISETKCQVTRNGELISLTPTEFKILLTLANRPGVVFSRLQLMKAAMDDDFMNYERTLDSHVSKLRKKLEPDPDHMKYIQTVYGFGYRFGEPR